MTVQELGLVPFLDLRPTTEAVRARVLARWAEVLDSSAFVNGAAVAEFEQRFAAACSATHAVSTANGTDALHLVLRALGVGTGDEVVVPANTFVATVEAVVLAGATPRFADVEPDTLLMSAATLEAATTSRTRVAVAVHLYGQLADMAAVRATTDRLGVALVEDAAQAHGATSAGRPAGSFGAAGCFSFYPGKNLGAFGDGGAVVTSDDGLAARVRAMRDHGRTPGAHYVHERLGFNSRLDTLQAVVLDEKLSLLPRWNDERRRLVERYRARLDPQVAPLVAEPPGGRGAHHLAVVQVRERDEVRRALAEQGVATGIHYPVPCHLLPPYASYARGPLPVAERAANRIMSLPLFPGMTLEQADLVADRVNTVAGVLR